MKARNNKTGEVVIDFAISKEFGTISYIDSNKTLRLATACDAEWTIIDEENTFDWQSFRNQAAKDILRDMIINEGVADERNVDDFTKDNQVKDAVLYADKLISKLKEKEN